MNVCVTCKHHQLFESFYASFIINTCQETANNLIIKKECRKSMETVITVSLQTKYEKRQNRLPETTGKFLSGTGTEP